MEEALKVVNGGKKMHCRFKGNGNLKLWFPVMKSV